MLVVRNQRFSEYDIGIKTAFSQSSLFLISWIKKIVKEKETIHTDKDFPNIHLPNLKICQHISGDQEDLTDLENRIIRWESGDLNLSVGQSCVEPLIRSVTPPILTLNLKFKCHI